MVKPIRRLSPYQRHKNRWKSCTLCPICEQRVNVVLARGTVPCDVLFIGEAPGACLAGDVMIDTAFRDKSVYPHGIPISQLVGRKGFKVYSFDQSSQKLALGTVSKVWQTGVRFVYRVSFYWWGGKPNGTGGRHKYYGSINVTSNHPFLLKSGDYQSIDGGLSVGSRIQPFYRRQGEYHYVGCSAKSLCRESRFLMEQKIGRSLDDGEEIHHDDRNKWNDSESNLILTDVVEHARLHGLEDNVMFNPKHRKTHSEAMARDDYRSGQSARMRKHLSKPEAYAKRVAQILDQRDRTSETVLNKFKTDPLYYYRYLKGRKFRDGNTYSAEQLRMRFMSRFPNSEYPPTEDNHQVYKIERLGIQPVYDMEVEKYHNFAANGVFVHNSEDVLGKPFVGPAGKLLDEIIAAALDKAGAEVDSGGFTPWGSPINVWSPADVRIAFTNLVACIPLGGDGAKTAEPTKESIEACRERLEEFITLAMPKLVVCVGKLAEKHLPIYWEGPKVEITHPAAILRADVSQKGLLIQKCIVTLADAVSDL